MKKEQLHGMLQEILDEDPMISPHFIDDVADILCGELQQRVGIPLSVDDRVFVELCISTEEVVRIRLTDLSGALDLWEDSNT